LCQPKNTLKHLSQNNNRLPPSSARDTLPVAGVVLRSGSAISLSPAAEILGYVSSKNDFRKKESSGWLSYTTEVFRRGGMIEADGFDGHFLSFSVSVYL